jgi:hypothetical protein
VVCRRSVTVCAGVLLNVFLFRVEMFLFILHPLISTVLLGCFSCLILIRFIALLFAGIL